MGGGAEAESSTTGQKQHEFWPIEHNQDYWNCL